MPGTGGSPQTRPSELSPAMYIGLVGAFLALEAIYHACGIRFNAAPLNSSWQFLDFHVAMLLVMTVLALAQCLDRPSPVRGLVFCSLVFLLCGIQSTERASGRARPPPLSNCCTRLTGWLSHRFGLPANRHIHVRSEVMVWARKNSAAALERDTQGRSPDLPPRLSCRIESRSWRAAG